MRPNISDHHAIGIDFLKTNSPEPSPYHSPQETWQSYMGRDQHWEVYFPNRDKLPQPETRVMQLALDVF